MFNEKPCMYCITITIEKNFDTYHIYFDTKTGVHCLSIQDFIKIDGCIYFGKLGHSFDYSVYNAEILSEIIEPIYYCSNCPNVLFYIKDIVTLFDFYRLNGIEGVVQYLEQIGFTQIIRI